jgi:diacylglycerol kinase
MNRSIENPPQDEVETLSPDLAALEERLAEWEPTPDWTPRAGRKSLREKLVAGLSGLKFAVRGDSSFFAHGYRGLLIAIAAALLGVGPMQWCFLLLSAALVLVGELGYSAVDALARALGPPDSPGLERAREIATAGVLVAVVAFVSVTTVIFVLRFQELLG